MKRREERIGFETLMHGWIIRYLYTNQDKDVFQKDIEQYFSIGRSTVTNIIQLMERKGYIARESVEHDARLKKVVLTEKGIRNQEMLEDLVESLDTRLVDGITDEELYVFYSVIEKLKRNLTKQICSDGRKEEFDDPNFIE